MGAVKQMYIDSLTTDRETGAKLCPNLENRLKDLRMSYGAEQRIARGRRLAKRHHPGTVYKAGEDAFMYIVKSAPPSELYGTVKRAGWIKLHKGRLVDGECGCGDTGAYFRGFQLCEHMVWAAIKAKSGQFIDRVPVTLQTGWDKKRSCSILLGIRHGLGPCRKPNQDETLDNVRELLSKEGYRWVGWPEAGDGTLDSLYVPGSGP